MKKFVFPLETLMKVRHQYEEVAKRDFGLKRRTQVDQEMLLHKLSGEKVSAQNAMSRLSEGELPVRMLILFQKYLSGIDELRKTGEDKLVELSRDTEAMREKLVEARRQRRIVELLRERHYKRYLFEADREEQRELDDITCMREARKAMQHEG